VLAVSVLLGGEDHGDAAGDELEALVRSAGGEVRGRVVQKRATPDHATLVGRGKVLEIRDMAAAGGMGTLVFDRNLTPGQVSRLEEATGCEVIDRTELIVSIFARRARTAEARLQVELAGLRYALPRMAGRWAHLSRLGGGIGTRGPGESQLEMDRRRARARIRRLEDEIERLEKRTAVKRRRSGTLFRVALAGYTNTGKSTLLNRICNAGVLSEDRLFATLDTTTRRLAGQTGIVLSDTVGFIERLPEELVASFHSTLSVVTEADLVILVGDASSPRREEQSRAVGETLARIGAGGVPTLQVWNKVDLLRGGGVPPDGIGVSARTGEGLDELVSRVVGSRDSGLSWFDLELESPDEGRLSWLWDNCVVRRSERAGTALRMTCGTVCPMDSVRERLSSMGGSWSLSPLGAEGDG
jgi:GTP-binding protein HflX